MAVNNHKHFILYVLNMILGIILFVRLTIACECHNSSASLTTPTDHSLPLDITILPAPKSVHCSLISDEYCAQLSKDPFVIVTCAWASLQLTWTFMLLFVHFFQVAQNVTTYESMRHTDDAGPVLAALTTGTTSLEAAGITDTPPGAAGPAGSAATGRPHKPPKPEGCLTRWGKIFGVDTFLTIAFQGYKGATGAKGKDEHKHRRKARPFSRGIFRNCQDFWMDGPLFGHKESGKALLSGVIVDYTSMYEMPRGGGGGMVYRGGYEQVAGAEEEV